MGGSVLQALLGGGQPDAQPGGVSPTDSIIKMILGAGAGDSAPAPTEDVNADNPGEANAGPLTDVLPPAVASKVATNPAVYPNLAAILGTKQTKVATKLKPLDYLIAAASPAIAGLSQMMMSRRRSDRVGNFAAGAASGGLDALINLATRGPRAQAAQHQQDIENILLQKTLRGNPTAGVDSNTGAGKFEYQTGETALPGLSPTPKAAAVHPMETRVREDAQGNKIQEEYDQANKVWKTSQVEEPSTDATGKTTTKRVPFMSPKQPDKPEKPLRELRVGSDVAGAKKGSTDDQYYWIEQGKQPVPSGLYRSASDKPTREGDIARSETKQVSQWAVKALQDSHTRLGPGKKPEDYVNDATETFRQASGTSKALAEKAPQVANAIRTMGRNVKSTDEIAMLIKALTPDDKAKE